MKSHDTSCGLGIGAGFPGFHRMSLVEKWDEAMDILSENWSIMHGLGMLTFCYDEMFVEFQATAFPTIIIVVYQIRELEWLGWLGMRMEWCKLSWDGKGLHGFIGSGWKAGFGFWWFHGWCSCIGNIYIYIYRYGSNVGKTIITINKSSPQITINRW